MRTTSRILLLVLVVASALAAAATPSMAADEPVEKPDLVHANLDWKTAVVSVVVFVLLLVVLSRTAWKPILKGLQQREETIRRAVDDAADASTKAKALVQEYERKLATAADEARSILDEGRKDAEAVRVRIEHDAQRVAQETMTRAQRDIEQNASKAYEEVLRQVAAVATEVAGRIVREHLDVERHAKLVDEVVRDFAQSAPGAARSAAPAKPGARRA